MNSDNHPPDEIPPRRNTLTPPLPALCRSSSIHVNSEEIDDIRKNICVTFSPFSFDNIQSGEESGSRSCVPPRSEYKDLTYVQEPDAKVGVQAAIPTMLTPEDTRKGDDRGEALNEKFPHSLSVADASHSTSPAHGFALSESGEVFNSSMGRLPLSLPQPLSPQTIRSTAQKSFGITLTEVSPGSRLQNSLWEEQGDLHNASPLPGMVREISTAQGASLSCIDSKQREKRGRLGKRRLKRAKKKGKKLSLQEEARSGENEVANDRNALKKKQKSKNSESGKTNSLRVVMKESTVSQALVFIDTKKDCHSQMDNMEPKRLQTSLSVEEEDESSLPSPVAVNTETMRGGQLNELKKAIEEEEVLVKWKPTVPSQERKKHFDRAKLVGDGRGSAHGSGDGQMDEKQREESKRSISFPTPPIEPKIVSGSAAAAVRALQRSPSPSPAPSAPTVSTTINHVEVSKKQEGGPAAVVGIDPPLLVPSLASSLAEKGKPAIPLDNSGADAQPLESQKVPQKLRLSREPPPFKGKQVLPIDLSRRATMMGTSYSYSSSYSRSSCSWSNSFSYYSEDSGYGEKDQKKYQIPLKEGCTTPIPLRLFTEVEYRMGQLSTLAPYGESAVIFEWNLTEGKWVGTETKVVVGGSPIAQGNMRCSYHLIDLGRPHRSLVTKLYKRSKVKREQYFDDVAMHSVSGHWARLYNSMSPPKQVKFVAAAVLELPQRNPPLTLAVEPMMQGTFRKYNNNSGYVPENVRWTPQAFSHFTYEYSGHELMIVDIQGVNDVYTDPQILSPDGEGYGRGNLGRRGIRRFFKTHVCNPICAQLSLSHVSYHRGHRDDNEALRAERRRRLSQQIKESVGPEICPLPSHRADNVPPPVPISVASKTETSKALPPEKAPLKTDAPRPSEPSETHDRKKSMSPSVSPAASRSMSGSDYSYEYSSSQNSKVERPSHRRSHRHERPLGDLKQPSPPARPNSGVRGGAEGGNSACNGLTSQLSLSNAIMSPGGRLAQAMSGSTGYSSLTPGGHGMNFVKPSSPTTFSVLQVPALSHSPTFGPASSLKNNFQKSRAPPGNSLRSGGSSSVLTGSNARSPAVLLSAVEEVLPRKKKKK